MAIASPRWGAATLALLRRASVFPAVGKVRWAWQAPNFNCYAVLGVSPSATAAEIKEAYLSRAKRLHPDLAGEGSAAGGDKMAQLNLCYEALTRHRAEYDAARGVGGAGARAAAYAAGGAAGGRDPWWRKSAEFEEEFEEMGRVWEEAQRRHAAGAGGRRSWRDWAETWRSEGGRPSGGRQRWAAGANGRRQSQRVWVSESSSEESSSESEWDSDYEEIRIFFGRRRGHRQQAASRRRGGSAQQGHPKQSQQGRPRPTVEPPPQLWIGIQTRVKPAASHPADPLSGAYRRLDAEFSGRVAYLREGSPNLFLFWSEAFGDWKVAERLEDDGACLAYATDERGRHMPWLQGRLRWRVWDPSLRRFVPRRVQCAELKEGSETVNEEAEASPKPLSEWTTPELIRWCEEQGVPLDGCFDRESVLERAWAASGGSADSQEGGSSQRRHGGGGPRVRLASRVKTDGSYTRPPSLDPRVSVYGNRVERFRGVDPEVLPWLEENGDKSRLYGVFANGMFRYSLVWKRQKFWGRPTYRTGTRREAYDL